MERILKPGTAGNQDQFYIDVQNDAIGWAYTEYVLKYFREHHIDWGRISPARRTLIAATTKFDFLLAHGEEYGIARSDIQPPFANVPSILDRDGGGRK